MRMDLTKQTILVVGGTSGFGREVAKQALAQGATVHVLGQNQARLQAMLKDFSAAKLTGSVVDATDKQALTHFFANFKAYDHLVSTLGGAMAGGFMANSVDQVRQTIEAKFFTNLQLIKLAQPTIKANGSITLTSGTGGHPATASGAIIGNQAINTLVAGLAVELAPNIRVNAVAPTWTPTGLWRGLTPEALAKQTQQAAAATPLKRVATIAEVASAYLYLMQNQFITGQVLNVDGGVSVS
ncbi:SDR family oxidoreductase [Loigolactobacillus backii]|nr:SDR family oxidoreductase [Loigolactobacillus backii]MDA5387765.1 SDR family oxidoreductase [Loigolactobacillus backii]MDA5390944.1 SDR family oxidoreductase [Loigolactobacillus backii]